MIALSLPPKVLIASTGYNGGLRRHALELNTMAILWHITNKEDRYLDFFPHIDYVRIIKQIYKY